MKVSAIDLREMLDYRPSEGKILLGTDRMIVFRQAAFGVLRSLLFERLGVELTRSVLSQFGYRCGHDDYRALMQMFEWDTDDDRIASGPVLHSWEGIVLAKADSLAYDRKDGAFHMTGSWESSYEAEIHQHHIGKSEAPICFTLAGYASGYASAFMERPMLCVELECVAAGAPACRWEIRPTSEWDERGDVCRAALESTTDSIHRELERSLARLSTPILHIGDGVLAMPLIGAIDAQRTASITTTLLGEVARSSTRFVILDVTGVESVDEATAEGLLRIVAAVRLLGARCHLSGMRGDVARVLSSLAIDLGDLQTFATLRQALRHCV
jgi:anti-anti-sigma regulatory factor